jgi:hypothetical protein
MAASTLERMLETGLHIGRLFLVPRLAHFCIIAIGESDLEGQGTAELG